MIFFNFANESLVNRIIGEFKGSSKLRAEIWPQTQENNLFLCQNHELFKKLSIQLYDFPLTLGIVVIQSLTYNGVWIYDKHKKTKNN